MKKVTLFLVVLTLLISICVVPSMAEEKEPNKVWNIASQGTVAFWAGSGSKVTSSGENYVSAVFNFNKSFSGIFFRCIWASTTEKGSLGECEFSIYKYESPKDEGADYDVDKALYSDTKELDGDQSNVLYSFETLPAGDYIIRLKQSNTTGYLVFPGANHESTDPDEDYFIYDVAAEHLHRISDGAEAVAFAVVTEEEGGAFAAIGTKYGNEAEPTPEITAEPSPTPTIEAHPEPTPTEGTKATEEPDVESKKTAGCGGVIGASQFVILASAMLILKRKEN